MKLNLEICEHAALINIVRLWNIVDLSFVTKRTGYEIIVITDANLLLSYNHGYILYSLQCVPINAIISRTECETPSTHMLLPRRD